MKNNHRSSCWTSSKIYSFAVGQQCLKKIFVTLPVFRVVRCIEECSNQSGYFRCAWADYLKSHVPHSIKVRGTSWPHHASMKTLTAHPDHLLSFTTVPAFKVAYRCTCCTTIEKKIKCAASMQCCICQSFPLQISETEKHASILTLSGTCYCGSINWISSHKMSTT